MAKLSVWYQTGYSTCSKTEIIDIPDEEIEDCDGNQEEIEKLHEAYARDWFFEECQYGFDVVK